jgi:hypothetical protein
MVARVAQAATRCLAERRIGDRDGTIAGHPDRPGHPDRAWSGWSGPLSVHRRAVLIIRVDDRTVTHSDGGTGESNQSIAGSISYSLREQQVATFIIDKDV